MLKSVTLTGLLAKVGVARKHRSPEPASGPENAGHADVPHSYAQPRVEPGSILDTIAKLDSSKALAYIDMLLMQMQQCIDAADELGPTTAIQDIHERIHALKNTLSSTGSVELLGACDQLGRDANDEAGKAELQQRYRAVAKAGLKLVKHFRDHLPHVKTNV
jgi:hypothetical protein